VGSTILADRRLAEASRVARQADSDARGIRVRESLRAPVRAIDRLLDDLERLNLRGGTSAEAPEVVAWLGRVEDEAGLSVPAWVREVPDTVRLHAAILRWQGTLLDICRPDRGALPERHDPLDLLLLPHAGVPSLPLRPRRRVA